MRRAKSLKDAHNSDQRRIENQSILVTRKGEVSK